MQYFGILCFKNDIRPYIVFPEDTDSVYIEGNFEAVFSQECSWDNKNPGQIIRNCYITDEFFVSMDEEDKESFSCKDIDDHSSLLLTCFQKGLIKMDWASKLMEIERNSPVGGKLLAPFLRENIAYFFDEYEEEKGIKTSYAQLKQKAEKLCNHAITSLTDLNLPYFKATAVLQGTSIMSIDNQPRPLTTPEFAFALALATKDINAGLNDKSDGFTYVPGKPEDWVLPGMYDEWEGYAVPKGYFKRK